MFGNKVAPDQYQKLRKTFFGFCKENKLTINEAAGTLEYLKHELQDQVCSGEYGIEENISCP